MTRHAIAPTGYTVSLCDHDILVYFCPPYRFFIPVTVVAAAIGVEADVLNDAILLGRPQGHENLAIATAFFSAALHIECSYELEFLRWARQIRDRQLSTLNYLRDLSYDALGKLTPSLAQARRMLYSTTQREREIILRADNPAYFDIDPIATKLIVAWRKDPVMEAWIPHTLRDNAPPPPVLHLPAGLIFERNEITTGAC